MARRPILAVLSAACVLAACANAEIDARTTAPAASRSAMAPGQAADVPAPAKTAAAVPTTVAGPTTPTITAAPTVAALPAPTTVPGPPIDNVINVGDAKPERFYDSYLAAALADVQLWWGEQFPELFGERYQPLDGDIYAAYPERTAAIPGCGYNGFITYQDVRDAGAFYCPDGDYIAYDDGDGGIIYKLADEFGPSIVAVVMAHEFGHAIQRRLDTLDGSVPTVVTEQQADCFSGAWARRAWNGEAPGVTFTDEDIRLGLIALVFVRDPIGYSVYDPGGHGSAFDRIGAFQEGFYRGPQACTGLIDHPLTLLPNEFNPNGNDAANNGNAPFGYARGEILGILNQDLTAFWPTELTAYGLGVAPPLKITPVVDASINNCGDPQGLAAIGAVFCSATNEILFDETVGRELYDNFGDFAVGYVIGRAWADGVQVAIGSALQGENRALASDCLTGAWIGGAIPENGVIDPSHNMRVSPGDLDEAVRTALIIGDPGINDDIEGSAFEKIAHLRLGVLNGLPACLAEIHG